MQPKTKKPKKIFQCLLFLFLWVNLFAGIFYSTLTSKRRMFLIRRLPHLLHYLAIDIWREAMLAKAKPSKLSVLVLMLQCVELVRHLLAFFFFVFRYSNHFIHFWFHTSQAFIYKLASQDSVEFPQENANFPYKIHVDFAQKVMLTTQWLDFWNQTWAQD